MDDDGEGVPPDQRDSVFDRFARLDADRARGKGDRAWVWRSSPRSPAPTAARSGRRTPPAGGARFVVELPVESLDDDVDDLPTGPARPA
ncbi:hypothetical protein BFG51_16770 [Dietzia alimentaria]|nr:hypothetical protein BFG51_16770 [Dietzia alimentaria]